MKQILATFINEYRLFTKDLGGLALLFLMPLALTILMALIQDAPFREYQHIRFDILWVNEDQGKIARELEAQLDSVPQFHLLRTWKGKTISRKEAIDLVQKGECQMAIVVPPGVSAEVLNSANQVANVLGKTFGAPGKLPERETRPLSLQMYFDPVTKQTLKLSLLNALEKQLTRIQAEIILARLESKATGSLEDSIPAPSLNLQEKLTAVQISEAPAGNRSMDQLTTNSVQHNVPAWALFGLFFIAIPIAANSIREREDGSLTRIKMIPGSYFNILLGKLGFYIFLGVLQFFVMLVVGALLLPLFGLPHLQVGDGYGALFFTVLLIAATATAYGVLIGTIFQTQNQALPFGAISIVLLSAIGGIWVPVEILPGILKELAKLSPLYWSLDAINDVFIRQVGWSGLWPKWLILAGFALFFFLVAGRVESVRKK